MDAYSLLLGVGEIAIVGEMREIAHLFCHRFAMSRCRFVELSFSAETFPDANYFVAKSLRRITRRRGSQIVGDVYF